MLTGVPSHFIVAKLKSLIKASPNLKDVFSRKHLELEETPYWSQGTKPNAGANALVYCS